MTISHRTVCSSLSTKKSPWLLHSQRGHEIITRTQLSDILTVVLKHHSNIFILWIDCLYFKANHCARKCWRLIRNGLHRTVFTFCIFYTVTLLILQTFCLSETKNVFIYAGRQFIILWVLLYVLCVFSYEWPVITLIPQPVLQHMWPITVWLLCIPYNSPSHHIWFIYFCLLVFLLVQGHLVALSIWSTLRLATN